jgi:dienelactone hydrolase
MKNLFITLYCCIFCGIISNAQVFQIGHTTLTFIDASRGNRSIATEIYYPSDVAGNNVPITTQNTTPFPSLVFGHGFVMTWDAYQNFWEALVPNGYIMAFPKTEGSFSPSHLEYGKDLAFVIDQMNLQGTLSTSIFYNRVSTMNAVMGHSMGGGASFLAVPLNSNIKTIVNFAPAETNPSAISASTSISIPSLIFAGGNDCVTPPNTNQIPMYTGLTSLCKTYIAILGGSHCQMANSNSLCSIGEGTCSPAPTITRSVQQAKLFSYLLPWLNYQLKDNCSQGAVFDSQIVSDNSITYQKNCLQCSSLQIGEATNELKEIVLYPNPVKDFISIKGLFQKDYTIKIYDSNFKCIVNQKFIESLTIDTSNISSGIYFYEIESVDNKKCTGKFSKQ